LIRAEGGAAPARCREAPRAHTDVCCDPNYRHSIRAYRYRDGGTVGLTSAEVTEILAEARSEHLSPILHGDGTFLVQEGRGQDTGGGARRRFLGCLEEPAAARGHSGHRAPAPAAGRRGAPRAYAPPAPRRLPRDARAIPARSPRGRERSRGRAALERRVERGDRTWSRGRRRRAHAAPARDGRAVGGAALAGRPEGRKPVAMSADVGIE